MKGKKSVGLYFSAHWYFIIRKFLFSNFIQTKILIDIIRCPPCRGFTPVLAEFYELVKEGNENDLEIIFVSSDSDDASFQEYYGEQPWVSIPYKNQPLIQALGTKYGIRGIPSLIIVDGATGATKDTDGRTTVATSKGNTKKALDKWA